MPECTDTSPVPTAANSDVTPPRLSEAPAASGGAEPSIGEPVDCKALIRSGESGAESDPVLPAGSPIDEDLDIPNFLQRSADNRAPWMAEEGGDALP